MLCPVYFVTADSPLSSMQICDLWVAMPPKTVPSKAPAASYSKLATIAPLSAPQTQPSTQPAFAGKTKLASAGIPDTTTLQAELEGLREVKTILEEEYRKKSSAFRELSRNHIALQSKFEHLTAQLEWVSAQLTAFQPTPAPAAATTPPRPPLTKDYASCMVQTDPIPAITASLPKNSGQQSFAQAVKASALRPDKPSAAPTPVPTPPIAPDSATHPNTPLPFKGRRATKLNELHIQLHSRAEFNLSMLKYTDLKLNHRHALHTAFVNAVSIKINKKTHSFFLDNHIEATFWSPRGNLIIRTRRTPSVQLQTLLLDTLEMICGGKHFIILTRPTLSLLKIRNVPTRNPDGSAVDTDTLTAELFHDARLTKASFWHLPCFVSFKGAPLGRTATVFFSLVDSPQYALGRSIVDTVTTISGINFKIQCWIPTKQDPECVNPPTGGYLYYKERAGDPSSHKLSNPIPAPHSISDATPAPTTTSPSLQHLKAAMAAFKLIKQGPSGLRP